jgi:hypothetical protein
MSATTGSVRGKLIILSSSEEDVAILHSNVCLFYGELSLKGLVSYAE